MRGHSPEGRRFGQPGSGRISVACERVHPRGRWRATVFRRPGPSWEGAPGYPAKAARFPECQEMEWQGSRDSNPDPTDLESVALTVGATALAQGRVASRDHSGKLGSPSFCGKRAPRVDRLDRKKSCRHARLEARCPPRGGLRGFARYSTSGGLPRRRTVPPLGMDAGSDR